MPQPQGMKKPPETTRSEDEPKIARVQVAHPECYPARYAVGLPRRQGVSACGPRRNEPVEASSSCWHLLTERTSALLSGTCVRSGIFPARGCLAAFGECGWARLTPKWWAPYWASPKGTTVTGTYMISGRPGGTLNLTDAAGTSTFNLYLVDPALNILDPSNSSGGGGALLLHTDASVIGTGILIPQVVSGSPSFSQNQGLNLVNSVDPTNMVNVNEVHLVGRLSSNGTANFTGTADYGQNGAYYPNVVKGNTVPALVYARRKHFISVFVWPSEDSAGPPGSGSIRGYQWLYWRSQGMDFCAVTDAPAGDLTLLAKLLAQ